jgi:hypothetical protein
VIVTTEGPALHITEEEWQERARSCEAFLELHATMGRQTPLTYSEVNSHVSADPGLAPFDFSTDLGRTRIGHLLGLVSQSSQYERGVMLTAIVGYLDPLAQQLGGGFFKMAVKLHRLPARSTKEERDAFWVAEVGRVFAVYGADRRRRKAGR